MPKPRKRQVSLQDTPYYHCISRCVRRAFLCGVDQRSGFDFSHRRGWIVARMKELASIFAIEICAYAVMSNHYHVVLRVDRSHALAWSDREVAERWLQLFAGPHLVQRWRSGAVMDEGQLDAVQARIESWRVRLYDLSWFMRCLNESIARMANREDRCTGRFWEGRFKSQALLDESALVTCMAYVDLNPIRAAMATTAEQSDYTSIKERIEDPASASLRPFSGTANDRTGIPYALADYLQLVDWAGRAVRSDKQGYIPPAAPPILQRLGMDEGPWLDYVSQRPQKFISALGPVDRLKTLAHNLGLSFLRGMALNRRLCRE